MQWRYDANPLENIEDKVKIACATLQQNGAAVEWAGDGKNFIVSGRTIPINDECVLLAHWLAYVYDYQMGTDKIWGNLYPIMLLICVDFKQEGVDALKKYVRLEKPSRPTKDKLKMTKRFHCGEYLTFKHRFETSANIFPHVKQTLETLEKSHGKSLLNYLSASMKNKSEVDFSNKVNHIRGLSYYLNRLTFADDSSGKSFLLQSDLCYKWVGHKRLWAALRDMLVFPLFWECLQNLDFLERGRYDFKNRDTYLEQLELPGDLWNDRMTNELQKKFSLPSKSESSGELARHLYNSIESLRNERLYPIYLDASYSLGWNPKTAALLKKVLTEGRDSPLCMANTTRVCPLLAYSTTDTRLCSTEDCIVYGKNTQIYKELVTTSHGS